MVLERNKIKQQQKTNNNKKKNKHKTKKTHRNTQKNNKFNSLNIPQMLITTPEKPKSDPRIGMSM